MRRYGSTLALVWNCAVARSAAPIARGGKASLLAVLILIGIGLPPCTSDALTLIAPRQSIAVTSFDGAGGNNYALISYPNTVIPDLTGQFIPTSPLAIEFSEIVITLDDFTPQISLAPFNISFNTFTAQADVALGLTRVVSVQATLTPDGQPYRVQTYSSSFNSTTKTFHIGMSGADPGPSSALQISAFDETGSGIQVDPGTISLFVSADPGGGFKPTIERLDLANVGAFISSIDNLSGENVEVRAGLMVSTINRPLVLVPEPSTALLVGVGVLGIATGRRLDLKRAPAREGW